jgi:hypothetical protein
MVKGTVTRDYNGLKVVWLKRPDFLLLADIGFNFFDCLFNLLLIFKILMQFAHIVFEFHLSLQKMRLLKSPFRGSSIF